MVDDKLRVRRRMAKTAFAAVLVTLASVLHIIFFGSHALNKFQKEKSK